MDAWLDAPATQARQKRNVGWQRSAAQPAADRGGYVIGSVKRPRLAAVHVTTLNTLILELSTHAPHHGTIVNCVLVLPVMGLRKSDTGMLFVIGEVC